MEDRRHTRLETRLEVLLEEGIDAGWFDECSHDDLRAYLGNLKAHRCRLDAVEANVIVALNRREKQASAKARPSDSVDDISAATGESRAEANRKTKRAELFEQWPQITRALADGQITSGHADLLTGMPTKYHDQLSRDLAALLAQACEETVDEFKDTVRRWKDDSARQHGEDPHQRRKDNRSCQIRKEQDGMVRLNARLDPETGAKVRNAVTEIAQDLLRQDQQQETVETRTYEQRMADAVGILADRASGADPHRPSRREPTLVVGIAWTDLLAGKDGEAYGAGPVGIETIHRLACEAGITPLLFAENGAVLHMGRKTRLATPAQRLALQARYNNQCAAPDCDRPFEWCHIHHINHWEHGGPTNLENLIPVCTRHHTQIHDGRLTIQRTNGTDNWHRKPA